MNGYYYFISHSAKDKKLASIIHDFLVNALGIPKQKVFCASENGNIPFGTNDYLQYIHDALVGTQQDNGKMIALITSNFMQSSFCKYEVGAAWALDIETQPMLFPPVSHKDSDIVGSPLSHTQSIIIEKEDLFNTIFSSLNTLINNSMKDPKLNGYINSIPRDVQSNYCCTVAREIERLLCSVDVNRIAFNALSDTCGVYHAEGFSKSMSYDKDIDEHILTLDIDFSLGRPPYAGYYIRPLKPNDWTPYINNKFFIRFDAYASGSVENVYIELKCKDYQITDKKHKLRTPNVWTTYSFYLGNQDPDDGWGNMKEICFVVKDDSLSGDRGSLCIRNVRLERDPLV